MNRWLPDFAYRIDVEWWIFALAGGLALVIALLTNSEYTSDQSRSGEPG